MIDKLKFAKFFANLFLSIFFFFLFDYKILRYDFCVLDIKERKFGFLWDFIYLFIFKILNHGFVGLWVSVIKVFVCIFSIWYEGEKIWIYIYIYIPFRVWIIVLQGVWFGKIFTFLCFFFNYKILRYIFYILGIKGNLFFSKNMDLLYFRPWK